MPAEFVDLVYIDPPFFTQRDYKNIWGDKESVLDWESSKLEGFFDTKDFFERHVHNGEKGLAAYLDRLLKKGGLYITFENTRPSSEAGTAIVKEYWRRFQVERGKTAEQAADHLARFDTKFFPITVDEHLALYRDTGFAVADCFWRSYILAGFYCVRG